MFVLSGETMHVVSPNSSPRFEALDGIRGLAAIMVVIHHVVEHAGLDFLPGAWVCVDLFFTLSGFVIMHSYGDKIVEGIAFSRFAQLRLIRLMPLYIVGVLIGAAPHLADVMSGSPEAPSALHLGMLTAAQMFLVPYVGHAEWLGAHTRMGGDTVFPLDPPAWSLFFELVGNFGFFLYLAVFRKLPGWLVALAVGLYAVMALRSGVVHGGWSSWNFVYGLPRFATEFALGAMLYRVRPQPGPHLNAPAAVAFLLVLVGFNVHGDAAATVNALLLCPLAIWLASGAVTTAKLRRACDLLGDMSYPIYVIHMPIYAAALCWFHLGDLSPVVQALVIVVGGGLLALTLAPLDLRLRRYLQRRMVERG